MKKLLFLLVFGWLIATECFAKDCDVGSYCTTVITEEAASCSLRGCLQTVLGPATASGSVTISGTFLGTLVFEQSADYGTTWEAASGTPQPSGTSTTSTTSTGIWTFDLSSRTNFRVRCSSYTSGRPEVTINYSNAQASSGTGVGGLSSLNDLTVGTQRFGVGTLGTDINWVSEIDTHFLNVPDFSCTVRGVVSGEAQVVCGPKTFTGSTLIQNDLYVTGAFSTDEPIEIAGTTPTASEANVGLVGFDLTTGLPWFSYNGSAPAPFPFPSLDQVLDPTVDKTFAMGNNRLSFTYAATIANGDFFSITPTVTFDPAGASYAGLFTTLSLLPSVDDGSAIFYGNEILLEHDAASTKFIGGMFGLNVRVLESTNTGASFPVGVDSRASSRANDDEVNAGYFEASSITGATGQFLAGIYAKTVNAADVASAIGVNILSHSNTGGGTTTINYGLKVNDQTAGITNYAIKTGLGLSQFQRVSIASGTALVAGDFALDANWGASGSIGTITGTDQAFRATVTAAGAGQGLNPTVTLTFTDGTWTNAPVFVCSQNGGTGALSFITAVSSATQLVLTYQGTPVVNLTYTVSCVGVGI